MEDVCPRAGVPAKLRCVQVAPSGVGGPRDGSEGSPASVWLLIGAATLPLGFPALLLFLLLLQQCLELITAGLSKGIAHQREDTLSPVSLCHGSITGLPRRLSCTRFSSRCPPASARSLEAGTRV